MSSMYELNYEKLVEKILQEGEEKEGRNGTTVSLFGENLTVNLQEGFPILSGRKLFYKGVLGELAAMLKGPRSIKDFEDQGCNYWKLWGKEDGTINVDYGNKWIDFRGINQLKNVIDTIKTNPYSRRMIVTGWDPVSLNNLDLPCCHYAYQWHVSVNGELNMMWHQRSVDTMIGLPSDVIFAAAWLIIMANEVGLKPGKIVLTLGDTHIYSEHIIPAYKYLDRTKHYQLPTWLLTSVEGDSHLDFTQEMISLPDYNPSSKINFELKA
jgi:thymidylate synthase